MFIFVGFVCAHAEEALLGVREPSFDKFLLVGGDEFVSGGAGEDHCRFSKDVGFEYLGCRGGGAAGVVLFEPLSDEILGVSGEEFEGFADQWPSEASWWEIFWKVFCCYVSF